MDGQRAEAYRSVYFLEAFRRGHVLSEHVHTVEADRDTLGQIVVRNIQAGALP